MNVEIPFADTNAFINELEPASQQHALHLLKLLKRFGNAINPPHSKHIESGIFELRSQGKTSVRLFYTFHEDSAYILHGLIKKRQKIPARDLDIARRRLRLLRDI